MSGAARYSYRGLRSLSVTRQLPTAVVNGAQQPALLRTLPGTVNGVRGISSSPRQSVRRPSRPACYTRGQPASIRPASSQSGLKKTQLYDLHVAHGAKMVPFAGYDMPLQYSDLSHLESHHWTREKASLFDVSHMVQHRLTGPGALPLLMKVTPSALDTLGNNQSTLSCLLEDGTGGIVDDTVITKLAPESFYFVTNAGRRDEDLVFLSAEIDAYRKEHGADSIQWEILSDRALVALQGPLAASVLQSFIYTEGEDPALTDLNTLYFGQSRELYLTLADGSRSAHRLLISRTGYTGEDGFEISIPTTANSASLPAQVTELLLSQPDKVRLAGLAARDSLRLEAGMCLYGHDLSTAQTPPTAALGWVVGRNRRDAESPSSHFNGASVILPQLASPGKTLSQRRIGLTIEKGSPAREGAVIIDPADKTQIGVVTSGLPSPSLGGTNIAMAYIKQGFHKKGTEVEVLVRNKVRKATVTPMPWVASKFHRPG
ncbi:aminomethyltransferase [Talaromyces islandicus]|uniref:Aminomethyltransferase n=1 Tax=Talaromyces islandicus TaxID=28573 RepID=A0A0U1LPX4_TALIS|nr:aminomethyltransferase [Talaromyces islandicus]